MGLFYLRHAPLLSVGTALLTTACWLSASRGQGRGQRPPVIASAPEASPLARQLLQVTREGRAPTIKLIEDVDGALDAVQDGAVDAAIISAESSPTADSLPIAQTSLWWVTRSDLRRLTTEEWRASLRGDEGARALQLCLRAQPDLLEREWVKLHPEDMRLLAQARREGRVQLFYDDRELLQHLIKRVDAVALFDEGRLKLYGAPLGRLLIEGAQTPLIRLWYVPSQQPRSSALLEWERTLRARAHLSWLRDLGWREP